MDRDFPDMLIVPFASATSGSALIEGGRESVRGLMGAIKCCVEQRYGPNDLESEVSVEREDRKDGEYLD